MDQSIAVIALTSLASGLLGAIIAAVITADNNTQKEKALLIWKREEALKTESAALMGLCERFRLHVTLSPPGIQTDFALLGSIVQAVNKIYLVSEDTKILDAATGLMRATESKNWSQYAACEVGLRDLVLAKAKSYQAEADACISSWINWVDPLRPKDCTCTCI